MVKLAAVRINGMVERLQMSQQLREIVFCLFQKVLSQRTTLFFGREIDQIILCCFYGVAKVCSNCLLMLIFAKYSYSSVLNFCCVLQVSLLKLTFKEIILNYRKQPHCKPQVFRSVYVDWMATRRPGVICQLLVHLLS